MRAVPPFPRLKSESTAIGNQSNNGGIVAGQLDANITHLRITKNRFTLDDIKE